MRKVFEWIERLVRAEQRGEQILSTYHLQRIDAVNASDEWYRRCML
jgi:hypothetical protein